MSPTTCSLMYKFTSILLLLLASACQPIAEHTGFADIHHVVVIGVDGMSPDGIENANTPVIDQLMQTGASTMTSRGVIPTSSGPNWASILMGAGPEQHGVTSNAYTPEEPALPPVASGTGKRGLFPTIFELIRTAEPEATLGAIYHWEPIQNYFEHEHVDYMVSPSSDVDVANEAVEYISANIPRYTFIHFDEVDAAGHSSGHGTPSYFRSVEVADSLVGQVVKAIDEAGIRKNTLILVTSDHGGKGYGHGENVPEVIGIPFILNGPNVKQGYSIEATVNTVDNSSTIAFALGLDEPEAWTGRPVTSAFEGFDAPANIMKPAAFYQKPRILPEGKEFGHAGGLFVGKPALVDIKNPNDNGDIRYTLDGTDPTAESEVFSSSFILQESTVVKAALFVGQNRVTNINTAYYRVLPASTKPQITATHYYGNELYYVPDFTTLQPAGTDRIYEFTFPELTITDGTNQLAAEFTSKLRIDIAGTYTFTTASDDGSLLYINGQQVVDNDGNHGVQERQGSIDLEPGLHDIRVTWFNGGGGLWLTTYLEGPGIPKQIISSDRLSAGG